MPKTANFSTLKLFFSAMSYASPKKYDCKNRAYKKNFSHPSANEQNAKYRKLAIPVERSSVGRSTLGPDTPAEFAARRAPLK